MRNLKNITYCIIIFTMTGSLHAQDHPSIHQEEWEYYQKHPDEVVKVDKNDRVIEKQSMKRSLTTNALVYGFHPYWVNGLESNYQFDLLSHLAYFSADVDVSTGNFSSTHSYSTAGVITKAKNAGVKVHLTIVCFSSHATLWGNQASIDKLINNIITKVNERNIDGVNIDFETMKSADASPFKNLFSSSATRFMLIKRNYVLNCLP